MQVKVMGIDIGKSAFHVIGLDQNGNIVLRKRFSRTQLLNHTANMPACLIGLEACCGAHHLGRSLMTQGHEVRLMPGQYVRPYVKTNKNDFLDAEGIAEAVQRPRMRFVPIKSDEQLDLQALHRVRNRLICQRAAVINQIRGFLLERGIAIRQGQAPLRNVLPSLLEDANTALSPMMRRLLQDLKDQWTELEDKAKTIDHQIGAAVRENPGCQRLVTIPGVGPITATAMVASIGNGAAFKQGRSFAAWLGLVPRQHSTGGKTKLLGIGKRENGYLRRMFIMGAQSMMMHMRDSTPPYLEWMKKLAQRAHHNVVVVALANKIARTAWAVLRKDEPYRVPSLVAS
jgi:transposase